MTESQPLTDEELAVVVARVAIMTDDAEGADFAIGALASLRLPPSDDGRGAGVLADLARDARRIIDFADEARSHRAAPVPGGGREAVADPELGFDPYDETAQLAMSWTLRQVGEALGAEKWAAGDGSESVEGDVWHEIDNIMQAAGLVTPEGDMLTKADAILALLASSPAVGGDADRIINAFCDVFDLEPDEPIACQSNFGSDQTVRAVLRLTIARVQTSGPETASAEGFVLVPREPTEAMIACGAAIMGGPLADAHRHLIEAGMVYDAMISADIACERQRQINVEGWTPEHDDEHRTGALAAAAGCYALYAGTPTLNDPPSAWPWSRGWWKPSTYRHDLVKAGALIVAEIERLDRAAPPPPPAAGKGMG